MVGLEMGWSVLLPDWVRMDWQRCTKFSSSSIRSHDKIARVRCAPLPAGPGFELQSISVLSPEVDESTTTKPSDVHCVTLSSNGPGREGGVPLPAAGSRCSVSPLEV